MVNLITRRLTNNLVTQAILQVIFLQVLLVLTKANCGLKYTIGIDSFVLFIGIM
jgi:hypothetical protein